MSCRAYHLVSGLVFALVALLHLVRSVQGLPVVAGSWSVPLALSWAGTAGAAFLSIWAFRSRG